MNVRGWMKTIPKDVIVRVDLWIGSQGGQGGMPQDMIDRFERAKKEAPPRLA